MDEATFNRKQTAAYIAANPVSISLIRTPTVPDGAGGVMLGDAVIIGAQTMRMIQQQRGQEKERRDRDGRVVRPELVLMAAHDADVSEDDEFMWDDRRFRVVYIQDISTSGAVYERLCEVVTA